MSQDRSQIALSPAQQDIIKNSMDYLLDLPIKKEELQPLVDELIKTITTPFYVSAVAEINQICRFLVTPENALFRLETFNADPVTIETVQLFMIDLITCHIHTAEKEAGVQTAWHVESIIKQTIPSEHKTMPFTSGHVQYDNPHPQAFINSPEYIYHGDIEINEEERTAFLMMKMTFPSGEVMEDKWRITSLKQAGVTAKLTAILNAHLFLLKQNIISPDEFIESINHDYNQVIGLLLIDKTYLSLLFEGKIVLRELLNIESREEFEALKQPSIKDLIKHNIYSILAARLLSPTEKMVVTHPVYYSLLLNKKIGMRDIYGVDDQQSKILTHPTITNSIKQEKISFDDARRLPPHLKPMLGSTLYINFFAQEKVDWRSLRFIGEKGTELLLHPHIAALLTNHIIETEDIYLSELTLLADIQHDHIYTLLENKKMTLDQLRLAPKKVIDKLKTDVDFFHRVQAGEVMADQFTNKHSHVFFKANASAPFSNNKSRILNAQKRP